MKLLPCLFLFLVTTLVAQTDQRVKIVEEKKANRIFLVAENQTETDLDVLLVVEGKGFRQPKGKPRKVRVPAASRVSVKNLIIERGKTPRYTFDLQVFDSLSRRVVRKPATPIKIAPKKSI